MPVGQAGLRFGAVRFIPSKSLYSLSPGTSSWEQGFVESSLPSAATWLELPVFNVKIALRQPAGVLHTCPGVQVDGLFFEIHTIQLQKQMLPLAPGLRNALFLHFEILILIYLSRGDVLALLSLRTQLGATQRDFFCQDSASRSLTIWGW
jgi:hypothetical protein